MVEVHHEGPPHVESSSFIGLLQKSPDATARIVIFAASSPSHGIAGRAGEISKLDCGRELCTYRHRFFRARCSIGIYGFRHGPLASYVEAALLGVFGRHLYRASTVRYRVSVGRERPPVYSR